MTHVVTSACQDCRHTDCVTVCPVSAFREVADLRMLVIDPDECIDCGGCVPVCPEEAIFLEDEVPEASRDFIDLNARRAKDGVKIEEKKTPLPGARRR